MSREQIISFKDTLLSRRNDILSRVRELEERWRDMSEPAIEIEEEAQRTAITLQYDRLDESGISTIEQIDLALSKLAQGEYGVCEHCGDEISVKRLEAVPWTRLCIDCAREFEKKHHALPSAADLLQSSEIPDEYQGLTNNQILKIINDHIMNSGKIDTSEIEISLHEGVLYLDGELFGEPQHRLLMHILTEVLGFSAIVDHLTVTKPLFERGGHTRITKTYPAGAIEDRLFHDEEEMSGHFSDVGNHSRKRRTSKPRVEEEKSQRPALH